MRAYRDENTGDGNTHRWGREVAIELLHVDVAETVLKVAGSLGGHLERNSRCFLSLLRFKLIEQEPVGALSCVRGCNCGLFASALRGTLREDTSH